MKTITKKITFLLFFLLILGGESWGQVTEGFEGTTIPATGWAYTSVAHGTNNPRTGTRCATFNANNDEIISPIVASPNVLTFYWRRSGTSPGTPAFTIQTATSQAGPFTNVPTALITPATNPITSFTTTYQTVTADLSSFSNVCVRILHTRASGANEVYLDDFSITNLVVSGPEMNIQGNAANIIDGDTTPDGADHTDFGSVTTATTFDRTFTIQNTGTADLTITTPITITGAGFSVVTQPATTVAAAGSTTFVVRFTAGALGAVTGNISIANNDSNENPYNFDILATSVAVPAPIFSFATATASIAENGTSINVTVNQSIANACSVNVALTGGTATQGTDFTFASPTTLSFNGTVTSQVINILISNNALVDGNRTFILTLQTATGTCAIGATSSITVTINDDDAPPVTGCLTEDFVTNAFPAGWARTSATDITVTLAKLNMEAANSSFTTLSVANPTTLNFNLSRTTNATSKTLNIQISTTSQVAGFSTISTFNHANTASGGTIACTVNLSAYNGFGTVYIRFLKVSTTTSPWRIDDMQVTCGVPGVLPVSNVLGASCINQATLNWDLPGNYTNPNNTILVFAKENTAITAGTPTNALAFYTADANFAGIGTPYQNDALAKCVFKGDGTNFTVTGLNPGSTYHFLIYNLNTASAYSTSQIISITPSTVVANPTAFSGTPGNGQVILTWNNASCYDEVLITAKIGVFATGRPTGNGTAYTSSVTFGAGTALLGGNVVYKNNGISTTTVSLTNGTNYCFKIFTRKGTVWSSGSQICVTPTLTVQPTVLTPGDIVIVGYNSIFGTPTVATDRYYFTTFVDLEVGTKFGLVNSRYESGAPANTRTNVWWAGGSNYNAESPGIAEFTVVTKVLKGSVIRFESTASFPTPDAPLNITVIYNNASVLTTSTTAITGAVVNPGGAGAFNINISSSGGDQIWVVQGAGADAGFAPVTAGAPTNGFTFTGKVLYALTNITSWVPTNATPSTGTGNTNRESRLHPDLECFNVDNGGANIAQAFYKNNSLHTGSKRELLLSIQEIESGSLKNWTIGALSETLQLTNETDANINVGELFTVNAGNPNGTWIGDGNQDWFNCGNWESLTVPDANTDVYFDENSVNDSRIDITTFATNAVKFGSIAKAKNLTINNQKLEFAAPATNRLDVEGDLIISNIGVIDMTLGGTLRLKGNWENQTGTANFTEGNGTVVFEGTAVEQTVLGSGGETFNNLTVNNTNNLRQLSNVNASGTVNFANGKIFTYDAANYFNFTVLTTGNLTGFGANKYFVTTTNIPTGGFLIQNVGASPKIFPVGTADYTPATITNGGTAGNMQIRVFDGVYTGGLSGASIATLQNTVLKTWEITPLGAGFNANITMQWNTAGSTFNPADCWVEKNASGTWERPDLTVGPAVSNTRTLGGVTAFSKFTVNSIVVILPIDLVSFTAKINQNNHAQLDWVTVSEINAQGFEIEKSFDGKSFEKIGYQNSLGGVDVIKNYQFFDKNFKDAAYYRLKMIDNDKSFKYSKIIYLNNSKSSVYELVIVPNPTQGEVKLILGNALPTENVTLKVFSITGKEIVSLLGDVLTVEKQLSNQLLQVPAGMYVVRMQIGEQILQTKLVKN